VPDTADGQDKPTAEDLLHRLITGRERLSKPGDGQRLIAEYRDQVLTETAAGNARLADRARRALAALDDLIYNCEDPGTEALGARYELAQELLHHPGPEAPVADPGAEWLALMRDRIAAEYAREDAQHWGYDHGFCEKYGADPETDAFVDVAVKALLGSLPLLAAARTTQEH
jgi:hypothetical protein